VRGWNYDGSVVTSINEINFFSHPNIPHAMGCMVACGDLDNDHIDEILTAPDPHPDNPARLKSSIRPGRGWPSGIVTRTTVSTVMKRDIRSRLAGE
jgi:hypothetical protein